MRLVLSKCSLGQFQERGGSGQKRQFGDRGWLIQFGGRLWENGAKVATVEPKVTHNPGKRGLGDCILDLIGSQPSHVAPLQSTLLLFQTLYRGLSTLLELAQATSPTSFLVSPLYFLCSSSTGFLVPFTGHFHTKAVSLSVSSSWMFFLLCVCMSGSFISPRSVKMLPPLQAHDHQFKNNTLVSLYPIVLLCGPLQPVFAGLTCICLPFHCVSPSLGLKLPWAGVYLVRCCAPRVPRTILTTLIALHSYLPDKWDDQLPSQDLSWGHNDFLGWR